eukprot:c12925_g1_i1 orf=191-400(-)
MFHEMLMKWRCVKGEDYSLQVQPPACTALGHVTGTYAIILLFFSSGNHFHHLMLKGETKEKNPHGILFP